MKVVIKPRIEPIPVTLKDLKPGDVFRWPTGMGVPMNDDYLLFINPGVFSLTSHPGGETNYKYLYVSLEKFRLYAHTDGDVEMRLAEADLTIRD